MQKFTVRTAGSDRGYEVLGGDWLSLESVWLSQKPMFIPGTEVEISDEISSKIFVKEHLSGIAGAMPRRK